MMETAYRAELVQGCPAAEDEERFHRELVHCCAWWLIQNGIWMLDNAHGDDRRWGISTWRQRVLVRLDALADTTEEFNHLRAMGETARRCTRRLREIWPEDADAMPLYPAFSGLGSRARSGQGHIEAAMRSNLRRGRKQPLAVELRRDPGARPGKGT